MHKCFACMCVYITCVQCLQKASDQHWSYSHELRRHLRDGDQSWLVFNRPVSLTVEPSFQP